MTGPLLLAALPLLPLAAAAAAVALRGRPRAIGPVTAGAMAATFALALAAAAAEPAASWSWGGGLELRFAVTGVARVVAPLVPFVAAPILLYAAARGEEDVLRLLAWMSAFVGAMEVLVLADDLLALLIGFELVAICSWVLIAHHWRDPADGRDAARAFLTVRAGDLGLYAAAGLAFAATGSFAFDALAGAPRPLLDGVALGVLVAAAAKSAQLPFSPWLFAAMAGPTPVSALLHSATMVAAGAYALARLAPAFAGIEWFGPVVLGLGLATALAGGAVAALHPHVKKALAASTSAQYGLVLVAIGAGSTAAATAHLVAHALFKALLFLGAGMAIAAVGTGDLERMRLGRRLPRAAGLFAVGALALAAVPPMGAAWTKEEVVKAAAERGTWLALGAILAGGLTALYAARLHLLAYGPERSGGLPLPRRATGDRPAGLSALRRGPRTGELAGAAVLAAATLALSALWIPGAGRAVEAVTGGRLAAGGPTETALSLAAVAAGLLAAGALHARGRLPRLGLPGSARRAAVAWLGLPAAARTVVARPTVAFAGALSAFDDRVIDAGVRTAAWIGRRVSGLFSRWVERAVDAALVLGTARATLLAALASRLADDRGVDAAFEGTAAGVGRAGRWAPRAQTGLAHHYLAILFAGLLAAVLLAAAGR